MLFFESSSLIINERRIMKTGIAGYLNDRDT
jgi:hypothetical protein